MALADTIAIHTPIVLMASSTTGLSTPYGIRIRVAPATPPSPTVPSRTRPVQYRS